MCISNLTFSLKLRRWQFSTLGFEVLKSAPRKKVVFYFCTKTADLACVWAGGAGSVGGVAAAMCLCQARGVAWQLGTDPRLVFAN